MPDHLHWLLVLKSDNLLELMRLFKGGSRQALNQKLHKQSIFGDVAFMSM